jgi:hypothetical protein
VAKEGIAFEALDNGIRSYADPARMQAIADDLSAERIDALLRRPTASCLRGRGCGQKVGDHGAHAPGPRRTLRRCARCTLYHSSVIATHPANHEAEGHCQGYDQQQDAPP